MSRLHRDVMRVLIRDITSGAFAPGKRLPRETDLSMQFDVSRGVARECIRALEERGLVHVKHGRGATVSDSAEWDTFDPDVLEALLQGPRAGAVLSDYLECRRILEVEAAGLAALRATKADRSALTEAFERMRVSAARAQENPAAEDSYHEADIGFHRSVVAASGNKALGRMTEPLHRALTSALRPLARPEHRFKRGLPEHERVLRAITRGDVGEARGAMMDHLATVELYLREYQGDGGSRATTSASPPNSLQAKPLR
jgi:DNA-binding FadR family transcriptional regulator